MGNVKRERERQGWRCGVALRRFPGLLGQLRHTKVSESDREGKKGRKWANFVAVSICISQIQTHECKQKTFVPKLKKLTPKKIDDSNKNSNNNRGNNSNNNSNNNGEQQ